MVMIKCRMGGGKRGKVWLLGLYLLSCCTLLISGCAIQRPAEPSSPVFLPEPEMEIPPPAVVPRADGPGSALYTEAKNALARGQNQKAEIAMERALRIEPSNAYYWYTLGKVKFRRGQYEETVQLCLKSKSLAGRNRGLHRAIDRLIEQARGQ